MDGEAGWWTTSGNIGLPPLARAMGVGRQQQVEAGDTDKDLLSLTALCCVPVTVQVAMLLNVPSVANHVQSFD